MESRWSLGRSKTDGKTILKTILKQGNRGERVLVGLKCF
jgi:hypothetical protein